MMNTRPRRLCLMVLAILAGAGGFVSCGNPTSEPTDNCDSLIGHTFIELQPAPMTGTFAHYQIAAGRIFNPQQGWYCTAISSSQVSGVVTLSTADVAFVRLGANGWVHGLRQGSAALTAASPAAPAAAEIRVQISS